MCTKDEKTSADEIEITPEMIEVGLIELGYYNPREDASGEPVVCAIFNAMLRASFHHKVGVAGRCGGIPEDNLDGNHLS